MLDWKEKIRVNIAKSKSDIDKRFNQFFKATEQGERIQRGEG